MNVLIDGQRGRQIPCDDRGFLYGESVFETIAFGDGEAPLWPLHMARLTRSGAQLRLPLPETEILARECRQLLPARGRFVVRITLSAGSGGRGYWPEENTRPRRVVSYRAWPDQIDQQRRCGLRLRLSTIRLCTAEHLLGLKHGNRLAQVSAARECQDSGHDEAILLDSAGQMMEAISSNLVLVLGDRLVTHPRPAVAGVGLDWLKAEAGVDFLPLALPVGRLSECSEVLVINSIAGVRPVIAIDQHRFPIGPICRHLQSLWNAQLI